MPNINEVVDGIYENVLGMVEAKDVKAANIISIAALTMKLVEQVPGLTGQQKKDIVIEVIKKLIDETPLSDEEVAAVNLVVDVTLPIVIDTIVSASRGELNLNEHLNSMKKCCRGKNCTVV